MSGTASSPILISAYMASPAHTHWDPALEGELLTAVCRLPGVAGLEVPWVGELHPHDAAWFLATVPATAALSLTPMPKVMARCARFPDYGLASPDVEGRSAALDDLRLLAADARRITGESAASVALVTLLTAPQGSGHSASLARSLEELASWDWGGAQLVIEHCDAVTPGHPHEKGFLSLEHEIGAIETSQAPVSLWMNWGRSAIEFRDADAAAAQIGVAAASGHLLGLTLSGAAATDGPYGPAWADNHLPISSTDPGSGSLLDDERVNAAIRAAGDVPWLGVKVRRRAGDRTAADVLRTIRANLDVVRAGAG